MCASIRITAEVRSLIGKREVGADPLRKGEIEHSVIKLGDQWVLFGLPTEISVRVTYRRGRTQRWQLHESPNQYEWQLPKLWTWSLLCSYRQLNKLENHLSIPGCSVVLGLFQAAGLILLVCLLWEWLSATFTVYSWRGRGLVSLVSFMDFQKLFWFVYFLS